MSVRRFGTWTGALAALALLAAGCAKKTEAPSGATGGDAATATVSQYDAGPRAGEQPVNDALVEQGEHLFQTKGCSACHAFGKRLSCPDLNGVTMRRTALWMENQMLHPEVMTKQDPIAKQLFGQYALQMPNLNLAPSDAKAVIEYLKHKNRESAEHHE